MAKKAWQQEHEVTGHMTSIVRKRCEMYPAAQLIFSFLLSLGLQPTVQGCPNAGCVLIKPLWKTHSQMPPGPYLLGDSKSHQTDHQY